MGIILIVIGMLICIVTGIMILIEAFKTSVLWGLGYLFVPFVALIFIIMNFQKVKIKLIKRIKLLESKL